MTRSEIQKKIFIYCCIMFPNLEDKKCEELTFIVGSIQRFLEVNLKWIYFYHETFVTLDMFWFVHLFLYYPFGLADDVNEGGFLTIPKRKQIN